ncbi:F-box protein SKIP1-like [Phalaenopsis equestris]|uniref:F-box protein SKIP1-like n=1 Tax=Phalaenopsis equestris TaxID=78828 RepID=UPI0009E4D840|nr:F-box protein SKIP1-like [Phalaenopsis equestris]XP_020572353.1 F-box protein SKIP1-like [Phalaenopsis equestris]XP_020572354.1 F-box protein SKIP1-like [Phalaenopsis equestris]
MENESNVATDCFNSEPKEVVMEIRDWSELTSVCLTNIFHRLSLEDRWRGAMLACRSWFEAAKDPTLFSSFDLEPAFDAAGAGRPDTPFWWTPAFQRRVDAMLRSVSEFGAGGVREIRVRHCSDASLSFAAVRSPNLQILSVKNSQSLTDASISIVASYCSLIRELDISNCYEISYKSLEMIGKNCPNLIILKRNLLNWLDPSQHTGIVPEEYLRACPQDGDQEAASIAQFMPGLKHLELRFSKLSIKGLVWITERCRDLELLDFFGCANLTSRSLELASAKLENLKTLVKPNFYIPRSVFHAERYGHWRLYDERFQTNVFQI